MRQNWLEWVALAVSVVAIVAVVGFLVVDGIRDAGRPPMPVVEVRLDDAYQTDAGWLVPATVGNDGDQAAEAVELVARAPVGDGSAGVEEAQVTLDYLPSGSQVDVAFGFSQRPSGDVTVTVRGLRLP
jgi:uncharacterized protein (TIGR02588 family)